MSVSGNPVAMYTPSNGQAHIFYRGDGDSRQGFVIEHVFWGEEYYNQPYVPKSEQWVGPNATYIQASRTGRSCYNVLLSPPNDRTRSGISASCDELTG